MRIGLVGALVAIVSVGVAHVAVAADMPVKAAPMVAPISSPSWAGLYVGAHAGYGWSKLDWLLLPDIDISQSGRGGLAGGQIGYNWLWNRMVFGVEFDGAAANVKGSIPCPSPTFACAHKIDALWSARGRVGSTFGTTQQVLVYATAGIGWGRGKYEARNIATGLLSPGGFENSATHTGWVGGVGVEYRLAPRWSLKAEYLYYGLRSKTIDCSPQATSTAYSCSFQPDVRTAKVGVNFHFGPVFGKP